MESVSQYLETWLLMWPALANGILTNAKQTDLKYICVFQVTFVYWGFLSYGAWDLESQFNLMNDWKKYVADLMTSVNSLPMLRYMCVVFLDCLASRQFINWLQIRNLNPHQTKQNKTKNPKIPSKNQTNVVKPQKCYLNKW